MSSKVWNVGVVGYGLSAKIFHIPFINALPESFKLYAIVQRSPKADDNVEKDWPGIIRYASTEELVKDSTVDVVVITTAPESHFDLAKLALEAGKHVIVEKPFTPTSHEASSLTAIAKEKSLLLTSYQNRRFDADFLILRKLLPSLGRVAEFETHFDRHRPEVSAASAASWKNQNGPGHGVVYDLGTHLMDQCVVLFGFPDRITAFVGSYRIDAPLEEDSCTILLHYDAGKGGRQAPLLCTIKASVVSPETDQLRYWVRGTEGSFKKFHLDCQEPQLLQGKRPGDSGYGAEPEERWGTLTKWEDETPKEKKVPTGKPATYTEYYEKFAKALAGDQAELPVSAEHVVGLIRMVELARESSKSGKTLDF